MRRCNHLLSLKKCNISPIYFEFVSIFYLFRQNLPLTCKTILDVKADFDTGGYQKHFKNISSSVINVIRNGGTFQQAYIFRKILIDHSYSLINSDVRLYDQTPQMFGLPDSHPLMTLLIGTDAEHVRCAFKYQ